MTNNNTNKHSHSNGGLSGDDLDSQISYFQEQLSKAQATLSELENLKTKLNNEKEAETETKTLKEENEKLKKEITDLKETIANIKNDFSQQAEEFKKNLLTSLEKAENKVEKINLDKSNHQKVKEKEDHKEDLKEEEALKPENEEKEEDQKDQQIPQQDNKEVSENENHHSEVAIPVTVKANEIIEEEFTDFEKIKKELEELENNDTDSQEKKETENPKDIVENQKEEADEPSDENKKDLTQQEEAPKDSLQSAEIKKAKPKLFFLKFFKLKRNKTKKDEVKTEDALKPDLATGRLFIKTAVLLMFMFTAGMSYQIYNADTLRNEYANQVKGVYTQNAKHSIPDDIRKDDPEKRYPKAFLDLSFDKTVWSVHNDSEFGIKIDYPENTSHRLKPLGSNNVWFIRKNGYLLSVEKIESNQDLESYWEENKSDIIYETEKTTFKKLPALHLTLKDNLSVRGNIYLIKANGFIYKVWYKTFYPGENIDDQQRVEVMLESLEFIKIK
jgi:myosin heavy subunit